MAFSLESPVLADLPGVVHGYFTRRGGVSGGIYDSLNIGLGSKDEKDAVVENRRLVASSLGVGSDNLFLPYQIHSPDAVLVPDAFNDGAPRADAVVSAETGQAVGVSTADCGPVLFADPDNRVVAAAHAGWRGALTGVLETTLEAMEAQGARRDRVFAVLGPTISGANYEVGPEFVSRFVDADPANSDYFAPSERSGHAYFDLPRYIVDRLKRSGVRHAENLGRCTYAEEEQFFSYRRSVHRDEGDYGRLVSAIALVERA